MFQLISAIILVDSSSEQSRCTALFPRRGKAASDLFPGNFFLLRCAFWKYWHFAESTMARVELSPRRCAVFNLSAGKICELFRCCGKIAADCIGEHSKSVRIGPQRVNLSVMAVMGVVLIGIFKLVVTKCKWVVLWKNVSWKIFGWKIITFYVKENWFTIWRIFWMQNIYTVTENYSRIIGLTVVFKFRVFCIFVSNYLCVFFLKIWILLIWNGTKHCVFFFRNILCGSTKLGPIKIKIQYNNNSNKNMYIYFQYCKEILVLIFLWYITSEWIPSREFSKKMFYAFDERNFPRIWQSATAYNRPCLLTVSGFR